MKSVIIQSEAPLVEARFFRVVLVLVVLAAIQLLLIGAPQLRLVGTNPGQVGTPFAIIENTETGTQEVFDINRPVFGDAELVSVEANSVTLRYNGELVNLPLKASDKSSEVYAAASVNAASKNTFAIEPRSSLITETALTEDGTSIVVLSNSEIESHFATTNTTFEQSVAVSRPEPVIQDGQLAGIRLSDVPEGNFLKEIGFQSGDVVRQINGQKISSMQQAMALAQESSWTDVEVERNGQVMRVGVSLASN